MQRGCIENALVSDPDRRIPGHSTAKGAGFGAPPAGLIEIELAGGVRVSVDEGVGLAALRRIMLILRER